MQNSKPERDAQSDAVVTTNASDRRQTDETLRASEQKTRSILRAAPIGIGMVVERVLREVNDELCRMTGYSDDELLGKSARMLYPCDEDYEYVGTEKYRQIAHKGTGTVETRWRRKSGEVINVLLSSTPLNPANHAEGVTFTALDITERLRAVAELREKNEEIDRFFSSALDLLCIADTDGNFRRLNPEWEKTLGYGLDELLGRPFLDFVHPEDLAVTRERVADLEGQTPVANFTNRYRHKDGSYRWIEWRSFPTGKIVYAAARDVTERKLMEQEQSKLRDQLQQAMKMEAIGRLAGGLAHDFNNLLTGITGNADLALMDLAPSDPLAATLREITKAAQSAATLTRQLLAFSRKQIIEPRVLNLNDLIANLQKMLTRLIGEDVDLRIVLGDDPESVKLDPGQFEQVIVNLAINARDAMPDGGTLVIETANVELGQGYCESHAEAVPGRYAMLAVSDTGMGMGKEVLSHLFEPFFTTKPKGKGTGLGLATIYGTVRQAGGTIEVYSEAGKGTTFKIYVPCVREKATKWAPESRTGDLPTGHETVLLVEDEELVRDLAERMLSRLGYEVLAARNGGEAFMIAETRKERIDLLLTDVVMPGMSGRELANRIAPLHPELKVLYTSGYTENIIVHHGVVDEGVSFIGKPYTAQGLARKLRDVLDGRGRPG
jgi:two-component system, cell cycle sensor histidine kinase and response regulator CckA